MEGSEIHYVRNGDAHIAYRAFGTGPVDMLWYPAAPLLSMESVDEEPTSGACSSASRLLPCRAVRCHGR